MWSSASRHADAQRGHFIRYRRGHAEPEKVAAPHGGGAEVVGHLVGDELLLDPEVHAARAYQPGHQPVVDDLSLVLGQDENHDPVRPSVPALACGWNAPISQLACRMPLAKLHRPLTT